MLSKLRKEGVPVADVGRYSSWLLTGYDSQLPCSNHNKPDFHKLRQIKHTHTRLFELHLTWICDNFVYKRWRSTTMKH